MEDSTAAVSHSGGNYCATHPREDAAFLPEVSLAGHLPYCLRVPVPIQCTVTVIYSCNGIEVLNVKVGIKKAVVLLL
jgi:hypothetical protein